MKHKPIRLSAELKFDFIPLPTFPIIRSLLKIFPGNSTIQYKEATRKWEQFLRTISNKKKFKSAAICGAKHKSNIRQTNTVAGSKPQAKKDKLFTDIGLSGPITTRWEARLSSSNAHNVERWYGGYTIGENCDEVNSMYERWNMFVYSQ